MSRRFWFTAVSAALAMVTAPAADQPQWGEAWSRNMVSAERGLPDSFDPRNRRQYQVVRSSSARKPIPHRWSPAAAFTSAPTTAIPATRSTRATAACSCALTKQTGSFLWQLVVPKRDEDIYFDWPNSGISSPVTVEGDRVYFVSNRGEVLCLDAHGMANGNDGPFTGRRRAHDPRKPVGRTNSSPVRWMPTFSGCST